MSDFEKVAPRGWLRRPWTPRDLYNQVIVWLSWVRS